MKMFKKSIALLLSVLMMFSLCSVAAMTAFADEATTISTVSKYFPACDSSETGIAAALESIGVDSSKSYRTVIAEANGIENYTGTAEQNTTMLNLLKQGLLINPEYVEPETTEPTEESTESTEATEPVEVSVNCALNQTVTFEYGSQVTTDANWGVDVVNAGLSVLTDGVNSTTTYAVNNGNVLIGLKQSCIAGPYSFIVNLGGKTSVEKIATYFYDRSNWSVEMPEKVDYYVSDDGAEWTLAGTVTCDEAETTVLTDTKYPNDQSPSICKLQLNAELEGVKYVKVTFDAHTNSSVVIAPVEIEVYGDEVEKAEDADIANVDLGDSFNAFVYNITSWKLLTPAKGNAVINERNSNAQLLSFKKNSDSSYYVYTTEGEYLTAEAETAGANIGFSAYTGSDRQKWYIKGEDGFYKFRSVYADNSYLEVADNSRENGANVQLNTASSGNEQYFQILEGTYSQNGYERGYKGGTAGDGVIYAQGIDVSKWNEKDGDYTDVDFNFKVAKAAGIDFAIIRAGSTKTGLDPMFEKYYAAAREAGLDVGAYFYTYATDTAGARADAEKCLSYIKGKTFEYPVYFDYEDSSQDSLSMEESKSLNMTFMTIMANEGYLSGMYTGLFKSTTILFDDICEVYDSWIARYYDENYIAWPEYSNIYGMWQYSSTYTIDGVIGEMDVNVCYKNYPAIVKQYGFNGYSAGEWTDNGYMYEDGTFATGWTEIGTQWYYFDETGSKTGEYSLDKNAVRLETGNTATVTANILNPSADEETVVWASANEAVATVDQSGNITAVSAGLAKVTASWNDMTLTCYIEVADPVYKDYITVKTLPTKTEYFYGEEFDSKGMQVRLYYSNNAYEIITGYELSGYDSDLGTKTITVTYEEFTTTFDVTVSLEEKVGIYGDINLDLTTEDEVVYIGTIYLAEGTYNFNVNNMATAYGFDGSFTDAVENAEFSAECADATEFVATGGTYEFVYDTSANTLTVTSVVVLGDANNDGEVDINDVTHIQKILAHITEKDDKALLQGDVDGNGVLSIRDVTYIQMYVAKYIEVFPVQ